MNTPIFIFAKQNNGDYIVRVNPYYLMKWKMINLGTSLDNSQNKLEREIKEKLKKLEELSYDLVWKALKERLRHLSLSEKKKLLQSEWDKGYLGKEDIPASVEKHFLKELS